MTYSPFIKQDYKPLLDEPTPGRRLRHLHWLALGVATACGAVLFTSMAPDANANRESRATQGDAEQVASSALPLPEPTITLKTADTAAADAQASSVALLESTAPQAATPAASPATGTPEATAAKVVSGTWRETTVKSGDSLARIFQRLNLSAAELHAMMQSGEEIKALKRIHPGETLRFRISDSGKLLELLYEKDRLRSLQVIADADGFTSREVARDPERTTANASATINSSLFMAAQNAGLSDNVTMELANIFGWDVDFALDIRQGDRFSVLYEELYLDGEKIGNGDILAAEFVNQGRTFKAVRYTAPDGHTDYYTPDGKSLRKAFLRTPVAFSRISSRFNPGRKHPILNRIRSHKGVDYAAPYGTPIKATGDGKIVFRGTKGGYGHTVVLQHGSRYSTLYAHMSRFVRGLGTGSRVKQGQVIGYIGQSGLATGPHLHYEFRVNGVHRNPLTVELPAAQPIPKQYRADFENKTQSLLARLDLIRDRTTQVALNNN